MRGLIKFIIFIAFLMALYYARAMIIAHGIEEKSMPFVMETAGAISASWNRAALDKVADPAIADRVAAMGNPHALDFAYFARLGPRVSELACKLDDYNTFKDETRNYISANYSCDAQFENGLATVLLTVMRDQEDAPWRVAYFDVASPVLSNPAKMEKK